MGSQSRRFRASKIVDLELFNLSWLLLLCLGFMIRPADHGHMVRYANSGAFSWEQRRSQAITIANPGAFSLKQTTSEVIAIANSTSTNINSSTRSNIFDGRCTVCGNYLSETDYDNTFQNADPGAFFSGQKTSGVFTLAKSAFGIFGVRYSLNGIELCELAHNRLLKDWNSSQSDNNDYTRRCFKIHGFTPYKSHSIVPRAITVTENSSREKFSLFMLIFFGSVSATSRLFSGTDTEGAVLLEYEPQTRPWFMVHGMEQIEVVVDNKIPMGTSTESPMNLLSRAISLDSIPKILLTLLRDELIEIMGIMKKLCHIEEVPMFPGEHITM